ncbi:MULTISPECIES: hypothetical protein [unclassified Streptomyces]|uniref:hypothetical protein n=1 Tax=unclassified Streptomyces TaxID=2593676 RepID=UPI002E7A5921|nr:MULTISPECIES: hypothetical protein [unclassified Streptomyces]MEE1766004.1 hypothetical protein [Streptomyces sp. SP18BB07]MEE1834782.1 hypothetical protein [Streptomyces sp. SP17KL33]
MRALSARRLAVPALCATLLLGVTAPAALAADAGTTRDRARSAAAPVPGADALLVQLKGLGDLGGVLKPVTDLLDAVLKADNGQLSAEQVTELGKAVRDAIDKAKAKATAPETPPASLPADPAAPAVPVTPAVPAPPPAPAVPPAPPAVSTPAVPAAPSVPAAPQLPVTLPAYDRGPAQPVGRLAANPVTDALAALQSAVDALLKAVTSGDLAQVVPAVTGVVTALLKVIAAILVGSGLPVPADLPPVQPPAELPVAPPAELPVAPPAAVPPIR